MNLLKQISILIILINFMACQHKDELNDFDGHTFYRITDRDSEKIIFEPCDAYVASYRFEGNKIYHNWGQEEDVLLATTKKNHDGIFNIEVFNQNSQQQEQITISRIHNSDRFWSINNEVFIDSLDLNKIKVEKEICEEEEAKTMTKVSSNQLNFKKIMLEDFSLSNRKVVKPKTLYQNCFSEYDVQHLNEHFRELKTTIRSNVDYDFSTAPIKYTSLQENSIFHIFKDRFCENELIVLPKDCMKTIRLEVFCVEEITKEEDEEHVREEYYSYTLEKNNNVISITKIDGAG
ncbi:hypothetical protein KO493_15625 [Tamlana agarivorans]|uniref:Uncharacterized protein n=1 Tax=Pseudotamlana agarivorans TaxID=481183 RepID=A0ACC5UCV3_9FLAO|nr:hypothetical protein [Tamlana agarivorans]MBU2952130.1 hypothetical protein [Tamlana agarivorans]